MAEIVQPEWQLKDQLCLCGCGGQGQLIFISCLSCSHTVLICAEEGTVFPNPRDLNEGPVLSGLIGLSDDLCPHCGEMPLAQFRNASSDEIQALGFKPGEYG